MQHQAYEPSQPLDGYDPRRGQNSDGYFHWLHETIYPPTPAWYWEALRDAAETPTKREFRLAMDQYDAAHE